ncbi:MAG: hypothetical protein ACLGSA_15470 [Acidobacteriota bacterium]
MKRIFLAAGVLILAAVLFAAGAATAQTSGTSKVPMPPAKAQGGNKALMEDWVRKKQALRNQVYEDLRRKGLLPRDGVVSFDALVKPDPQNPGKVTVKIESLTITERPKGQGQGGAFPQAKNDPIFGARTPNGQTQAVEASIPMGGGTMRETITIVGGKPQEQARP